MEINENENIINSPQYIKLKQRIPYDSDSFENIENYERIIKILLEDSKNIALSNLYPFEDWSERELPKKYWNWQLRACIEIYNFLGKEGVKAYSENGLSYSKITDGLSQELQNEIMPNAGYIINESMEENYDKR